MAVNKDDGLKYPYVISIVGVLFLFAPLFNFVFSLFIDNIPEWYLPSAWVEWAPRMVRSEYVWQSFISLAGIGMLIRQKWSWAFAALVLAIITGRSIIKAILFPLLSGQILDKTQFIFIGSSLGILILLFYYRYPYLDRRESLFGINFRRYKLDKDAKIHYGETLLPVIIKNISTSGFYCECPQTESLTSGGQGLLAHVVDANIPFKIMRLDERGFGGKFAFLNKEQKKHFLEWLENNLK